MILIFFGPPGAGKGTQASLISKKLNIPHLSTGNILRKKISDSDYLSEKLRATMDGGNLVSDDILNEIVINRLNNSDCNNGFVLDGYPRTIAQKDFFESYLKIKKMSITKIFDLIVDEKVMLNRIKSRLKIENREDDKDNIIKNRRSKYLEETQPLSNFYNANHNDNYHVISGNQGIEMIHSDILKILKK